MNTLLYLSYGTGPHNDELRYSLLSALSFLGKGDAGFQIVVYTDDASAYGDLPVTLEILTPEILSDWAGPFSFIHRRKILVIKEAISKFGGKILYVDADTHFIHHPSRVFAKIREGQTVMHRREAHLDRCYAGKLADHLMDHRPVKRDGTKWHITANTWMWNAGVIGINHSECQLLDKILHLNDQLYPHVQLPTIEQFSFTAVLGLETKLDDCQEHIFHYYSERWREPFRIEMRRVFTDPAAAAPEQQFEILHTHRPMHTLAEKWRLRFGILAEKAGISRNKDRVLKHGV